MSEMMNRRDADYTRLLDLDVLTAWTLDRQRAHASDTHGYEAALAAFQTALRSQVVDGDGRTSAPRRARKVEKHLKALVKASLRAERAAEALRLSYAAHQAHVQALPAQREAKAVKKAGRRESVAALTAKSLHKSASAFAPAPAEGAAQESAAEPGRPVARGINDLFQQRRGA